MVLTSLSEIVSLITNGASSYATAYPNIRTVGHKYMTVRLFIDGNGKQVLTKSLTRCITLTIPDSSVTFAEKIAASTLSLRKTYILVWSNYGGVAQSLAVILWGRAARILLVLRSLEFPRVERVGNKTTYSRQYTDVY